MLYPHMPGATCSLRWLLLCAALCANCCRKLLNKDKCSAGAATHSDRCPCPCPCPSPYPFTTLAYPWPPINISIAKICGPNYPVDAAILYSWHRICLEKCDWSAEKRSGRTLSRKCNPLTSEFVERQGHAELSMPFNVGICKGN